MLDRLLVHQLQEYEQRGSGCIDRLRRLRDSLCPIRGSRVGSAAESALSAFLAADHLAIVSGVRLHLAHIQIIVLAKQ